MLLGEILFTHSINRDKNVVKIILQGYLNFKGGQKLVCHQR